MCVWTIAALLPIISTLLASLKSSSEIIANPLGLPSALRFGNFTSAWAGPEFGQPLWRYAVNSTIAVAVGVTLGLTAGTLAGYALVRSGRRMFWLNRYFVMLLTIPAVVTWVPLFSLASSLNLLSKPVALGLIYGALIIPLVTVIMRAYFASFPRDLVQAACVDGASELRAFFTIVLPMSTGAIMAVALLQAIALWNELALALILLLQPTSQTLPLGLIQFRGEFNSNLGPQFAGLLLAIVPVLIMYVFMQRRLAQGVKLGMLT